MREIKFRAWDAAANEMLHMPITGNFGLHRFFGYIPENAPIMQFTGLFDKNGIEIFEGDIVTGTYYQFGQKYSFTGEVKYVITAFKVVGTKSYNGMHQELNSIYEIIGNIHTQKP
jgi:uncharacterized phage protein (TIGR01671 family)